MGTYITRRLMWTPVLLLIVSFITFALGQFGPGCQARFSALAPPGHFSLTVWPMHPHRRLIISCVLRYFMLQIWDDPPSAASSVPHWSARHRPAHVAHVHASLMSRSLVLVSRREPNAMTLIRARDPKSWPTFRVDEKRFLDGSRATT